MCIIQRLPVTEWTRWGNALAKIGAAHTLYIQLLKEVKFNELIVCLSVKVVNSPAIVPGQWYHPCELKRKKINDISNKKKLEMYHNAKERKLLTWVYFMADSQSSRADRHNFISICHEIKIWIRFLYIFFKGIQMLFFKNIDRTKITFLYYCLDIKTSNYIKRLNNVNNNKKVYMI